VQVNAISPGIFPDPVSHPPEMVPQLEAVTRALPAGRAGDAREVGYLTLYLVSAAGDYVTGQTIVIDGGLTL
jgi:NAD(P)-dependent dehydrogenase (short-subunit alcohol dehydrogenase family)